MNKQVKLKIRIVERRGNDGVLVESRLTDGTPIQFVVPARDVNPEGWIWALAHGIVENHVSLTLPSPVTNMGTRVTVMKEELLLELPPSSTAVSGIFPPPRKK